MTEFTRLDVEPGHGAGRTPGRRDSVQWTGSIGGKYLL